MYSTSAHEFRKNMKSYIDKSCDSSVPVAVSRRNGEDFVVVSMADYLSDQEALYVLQNKSLKAQLDESLLQLENSPGSGKKFQYLP